MGDDRGVGEQSLEPLEPQAIVVALHHRLQQALAETARRIRNKNRPADSSSGK
jgi:hypothetical protein